MKKLSLLLIFFISASHGFSQSFRLYGFIDSRLTTLSMDKQNLEEMAKHLPNLLNLKAGDTTFADPTKYSYDSFKTAVNKIQEGDVFLFYFGGEGDGKDKNKDKNQIYFMEKAVKHSEIIQLVEKRKPRIAVILIEGSNKQALTNEGEYVHDHAGVVSRQNASKLFSFKLAPKDVGTTFYMNATEPPKPAQKNRKTGSYFLSAFKNNLYNEMGESNPKWENILTNVKVQVEKFTKNVQKPYGYITAIK